jgi:hypothetical protein
LAGAAIVAAALGVVAYVSLRQPSSVITPPPAAADAMGSAQFDSQPSGAEVFIDGVVRGKTPLRVTLPVGEHSLEIRGATGVRALPLTIEAGVLLSQYVELVQLSTAAAPPSGALEVTSDPPGAHVRLDGALRGTTPLTLDTVPIGERFITLSSGGSTIRRVVKVAPGATASVVVSFPGAGDAAVGWLTLNTTLDLQVFESGRLVGTSRAERLMLPTGRHELELVNVELEFRTTTSFDVRAGAITKADIALPNGVMSVNALPWAEVTVDGREAGTTPLANLAVPIGRHEVVWRHPEHGERRQQVVVPARTPVRVSVDFTP